MSSLRVSLDMSLQEAGIGDFGSTGSGSIKGSQDINRHLNLLPFYLETSLGR